MEDPPKKPSLVRYESVDIYFVFYSRKRLVLQAPEEEAALLERAQAELARDPVR